ncbi:hypothetical protein FQR65_LT20338 [Abscondita terminalis]|nr:hypothetical protein FQR65_LT20338 [Abscondita terminalis]
MWVSETNRGTGDFEHPQLQPEASVVPLPPSGPSKWDMIPVGRDHRSPSESKAASRIPCPDHVLHTQPAGAMVPRTSCVGSQAG